MSATIYALGVGPGDPELIICKAARNLRSVDVFSAPNGQTETATVAAYESEGLRQSLIDYETVVLKKSHRRFEQLFALLEETGRLDEADDVRRVGSADQEGVSDLRTLVGKPLDYLSRIIVSKHR